MLFPVLISLGVSVLMSFSFFVFSRRIAFSIFAGFVFIIFFWYYGVLWLGLNKFFRIEHWHLIPILILIYGHIIYYLSKVKKAETLKNLSLVVVIPLALLIIFNIVNIIPNEIGKYRKAHAKELTIQQNNDPKEDNNPPDIFLIVLDEYSEFRTIRDEWGYTDSTFYYFLNHNNFHIIPESHSRFTNTTRAIPSLLNLDYIGNNVSSTECLMLYDDNFVFRFFDQLGYEITFINGWSSFAYSRRLENVKVKSINDNNFAAEEQIDQFHYLAFSQSILKPFMYRFQENSSNIFYLANKFFFSFLETQAAQRTPYAKGLS